MYVKFFWPNFSCICFRRFFGSSYASINFYVVYAEVSPLPFRNFVPNFLISSFKHLLQANTSFSEFTTFSSVILKSRNWNLLLFPLMSWSSSGWRLVDLIDHFYYNNYCKIKKFRPWRIRICFLTPQYTQGYHMFLERFRGLPIWLRKKRSNGLIWVSPKNIPIRPWTKWREQRNFLLSKKRRFSFQKGE